MLEIDLTEPERAARSLSRWPCGIAESSRGGAAVSVTCEAFAAELQGVTDAQECKLRVAFSGVTQRIQLGVMRARATVNAPLAQSLANREIFLLIELFGGLCGDVNARCAQTEHGGREVQTALDVAERQWSNDVSELRDEMSADAAAMRHNAGPTGRSSRGLRR